MTEIVRSDEEIDAMQSKIDEEIENERMFGMTYGEGLRNMIDWLTDDTADEPLD